MRNTPGDIVEFGVRCSDLLASLTQVDSLTGSGNSSSSGWSLEPERDLHPHLAPE